MTDREIKWAILELHRVQGRQNKWNTLGKPYQRGSLELALRVKFDSDTRSKAERAFDWLRKAGYLQSDLGDLADPGNWVHLSAKGSSALERRALDVLDEALASLSPGLTGLRDGAWAALETDSLDAPRQAADAAFELVSQTLKASATDEEIMNAKWFTPDSSSENGVTRAHRARMLMERRHGRSDEDCCEAVAVAARRLAKLKHSRVPISPGEVRVAIEQAELALQIVLVSPSQQGA